jgi:hypothetical protein
VADHVPGRPSWDCLVCEKSWPCDPAREELAGTMDGVQLAMFMWDMLEQSAGDLSHGPRGEIFERFIKWTR